MNIQPILQTDSHIEDAKTKLEAERLHKTAMEFEQIFVRQLLQYTPLAGKDRGAGYGSMAIDAIAQSVTSGGGLGLVQQIEDSISERLHPHRSIHSTQDLSNNVSRGGK